MAESLFSRLFPVPRALAMEGGGLEIAERAIKYLRLARPKRFGRAVAVYGEEPIPEGTIAGGEIRDAAALTAALRAVRSRCGFGFAHVSLPEQRGYIFDLSIPRASIGKGESVADSVLLALPEHVPLAPAEAVFDCETITPESDANTIAAVVTVFPESIAQAYAAALASAGFLPLSFELEPQAATRAITSRMDAARSGAHLLIDIGSNKTLLSIIQNGVPRFTTSIEGMHVLDASLAERAGGPSFEAIEKLKSEQGFLPGGELNGVFVKAFAPLLGEISRLLVYWNGRVSAAGAHEPLRSAIIYGGNANIRKLPEYISASAGVPAFVADLRPALTGDPDSVPPISKDQSLRYATAVGLALRVEGTALW